jgi:hypothetical protein
MDFYGTIRAKNGGPPLSYDRWCEFVSGCKDLVRGTPITGRNPKTDEPLTIRPRPDGASVVINAKRVGFVEWSQSGEDEVFVSGDPNVIVSWAAAVAAELGAEFAELPSN